MPTAAKNAEAGLFLIAGPCVIENGDHVLGLAAQLRDICRRLRLPLVFKASFDKANRSSVRSYRGPGLEAGLAILRAVKEETGLPVLSDVHETWQVERAAEVLDVLQIPAFLCRQTDLVIAAARTGKPVNIKKGPFMSPAEMGNVIEKILGTGNACVLVTERGTTFGYNNLVVDMRAIPLLKGFGVPVVIDASHAVQRPGGEGASSGGDRDFIPVIARAAVAAGADGVFLEVHDDPSKALSDKHSALLMDDLEALLKSLLRIRRAL
jgi:2-dehydro-3-deoxyphosphooctonate aldolase (KDO 8-P synthase)